MAHTKTNGKKKFVVEKKFGFSKVSMLPTTIQATNSSSNIFLAVKGYVITSSPVSQT